MIRSGLRTYLLTISEVDALNGDKVYVSKSPQGAADTHVVIERVDDDHNNALDGTGGTVFADFDIDCKAKTPLEADTLAEAIKDEIDDYTGSMGDETCLAVIFNGFDHRNEPIDDRGDAVRYVTTLAVQIQYS